MKKIIIIFILVFFINQLVSSESWKKLQLPCPYPTSLEFLNNEFGIIRTRVVEQNSSMINEYLTTDGGISFKLINDSLKIYNLYDKFGYAILKSNLILLLANQFDFINKKYNYYIYKSIDSCKTWQKQIQVFESDYNNKYIGLFEYKQQLFLKIQSDLYYTKDNELKFNKLISPLNISSFDIENEFLGAILEYENLAEPYPVYYDYCRIYKNYSVYYDTVVFLKNPIPEKNKTKLLFQILSLKNNRWVIRSEDGFEITENNGKEWFHIEINSDSILGYSMSIRPDNFIYIYGRFKPSFNQMFITNNFKDFIRCQVPKNSNGFRAIQSINNEIAYAVSDSGLYKTTDGGGVFTDVEEEEIKEAQEIKISSSKNSSFSLELKYPPSEAKLELINIMGVPLFSQSTSSQLINISLENYLTGIYLLKYTDMHSTQVFKLMKE